MKKLAYFLVFILITSLVLSCSEKRDAEAASDSDQVSRSAKDEPSLASANTLGRVFVIYALRFPSSYGQVSGPHLVLSDGGYLCVSGLTTESDLDDYRTVYIGEDEATRLRLELAKLSDSVKEDAANSMSRSPGTVLSALVFCGEDRSEYLEWDYNYPSSESSQLLADKVHKLALWAHSLEEYQDQDENVNELRRRVEQIKNSDWDDLCQVANGG